MLAATAAAPKRVGNCGSARVITFAQAIREKSRHARPGTHALKKSTVTLPMDDNACRARILKTPRCGSSRVGKPATAKTILSRSLIRSLDGGDSRSPDREYPWHPKGFLPESIADESNNYKAEGSRFDRGRQGNVDYPTVLAFTNSQMTDKGYSEQYKTDDAKFYPGN